MSDTLPYDEAALLRRIARDDERAFTLVVAQHTARIYAHVLSYLKRPALAEEITQDILLSVWKHRTELPGIVNFPGWLYVITRNRTHSAFRIAVEQDALPLSDALDSPLLTPQGALEYRELSQVVLRGIELLPPRRQQVFRLSRLDGKTHEEIAQHLGITKSAVNQHIVEALGFLRTWLQQELGILVWSACWVLYLL